MKESQRPAATEAGWDDLETLRAARAYHARRDAQAAARHERFRQERHDRAVAAIRRVAPAFPALRAVYLFGSLVRPGALHRRESDIDVAVLCADLETESRFWQALEEELHADVDVRPVKGAVADAVAQYGELVYEREISAPGA